MPWLAFCFGIVVGGCLVFWILGVLQMISDRRIGYGNDPRSIITD